VSNEYAVTQNRFVVIEQRLRIVELELHEPARNAHRALRKQCLAADEAARLVERHGERKARFEWCVFIGDVVTPVPEPFLQPQ